MITLFSGGKIYSEDGFFQADVLTVNNKIAKIGSINGEMLARVGLEVETIDCSNCIVSPGLIDSHLHLCGGSGERGGFATQTPTILASECIRGANTTVIGTLGVDTTTKTMRELVSRAKAFNEIGLNAFCYTGGYDTPTRTLLKDIRDDIIFVEEIIGVGEIAIADDRAPEPDLQEFASSIVDAYVAGMLSTKAGVSHIHAGGGKRGLQLIRDVFERHEIHPEILYITHIGRSKKLVEEAVDLARKGCFVDLDVHDRDLQIWYPYYKSVNGPLTQLSFTSDAGMLSPAELWAEIRKCVLEFKIPILELLPSVTRNPARALKFHKKGKIAPGFDADLFAFDEKDLEIKHVMARGKVLMNDSKISFPNRCDPSRRGFDLYGILEI